MFLALPRFIIETVWRRLWGVCNKHLNKNPWLPREILHKLPPCTAQIHTSAGQANNQAVTRCDLNMLAQNLTSAFAEQLHAIVNANAATPHQQVLADIANQIENLKKRIEPHSSFRKLDDRDTQISRSSKRNRQRKERSKLQKSFSKGKEEWESKPETPDARSYLNEKRAPQSHNVQSLVDKKQEERKMSQLSGSSYPTRPITPLKDDFSRGPQEAPVLLNSLLSAEILATPNPAKIKIPNMNPFDGTKCLEEHIVAYKNLMLLYTTNQALLCKFFPTTLSGVALNWYTSLPVGSIHTFAQLEAKFVSHFVASKQ